MDDTKLNTFIAKVDAIIEKINAWNYSSEKIVKYNAMLNALKEIALDNLDSNTDLDIESLFN